MDVAKVASAIGHAGKDRPLGTPLLQARAAPTTRSCRRSARRPRIALRNRPDHLRSASSSASSRACCMRRSVRRLESQLRETERRCDSLLDSSRDPIAYVHEGMHVRANKAYLEMFGFEEFEEIEGMSILDMIAPDDADDFKALLKQAVQGREAAAEAQSQGAARRRLDVRRGHGVRRGELRGRALPADHRSASRPAIRSSRRSSTRCGRRTSSPICSTASTC